MKRTAVRLNINRVREIIGCGGQDIHFIARVVSEKRPLITKSCAKTELQLGREKAATGFQKVTFP